MPEPFDVAIVGLGPVGAALAARLGRLGHRVVALERSSAPHTLPRAAHLDDDALRVLQGVDALDAVLAHGRVLDGFDLVDRDLRTLLRARTRSRWPTSLPSALLVHQPTVEAALGARLAALPTVEIRRGHEVDSIAQDGEGVTISGRTDAPFSLRAAYVVGCDGARSVVREAMESPLQGGRFEERWLVIDTLASDTAGLPDRLLQIADARQPATYVPFPGRRRRWEFRLSPDDDTASATRPEAVRRRLAPWLDSLSVEIERATVYTFHDLVAHGWRRGRLLIAGDAAHQMPPFLGQGLGAGLRDTATLAWMLDLVLRAAADPALLDVYEAERRPHVEATTRLAVRLGRLISASGPTARLRDAALGLAHRLGLGGWLRTIEAPLPRIRPALPTSGRRRRDARLPQPVVGRGEATIRLDDALGSGFAVVGIGVDAERWTAGNPVWRALRTTFLTLGAGVWDPSGVLAAWAGGGPCAVVVRPDRLVFGIYGAGAGGQAADDVRSALGLV